MSLYTSRPSNVPSLVMFRVGFGQVTLSSVPCVFRVDVPRCLSFWSSVCPSGVSPWIILCWQHCCLIPPVVSSPLTRLGIRRLLSNKFRGSFPPLLSCRDATGLVRGPGRGRQDGLPCVVGGAVESPVNLCLSPPAKAPAITHTHIGDKKQGLLAENK